MPAVLKKILGVLIVAALAGLAAAGFPWNDDMVVQPSVGPSVGPWPPAPGALPVNGEFPLERWQIEERVRSPLPAGDSEAGRRGFEVYCAPCHGTRGSGDGPVVKVFVQPGDLRAPEVQDHSDAWIYGTIRNGVATMPRYGAELAPRQRWEVVRHVRSLRERPQ